MLEILTLSQLVVILGFVFLLTSVVMGVEAGIEFLFIGSILIIGGLLGSFTDNHFIMLATSAILGLIYIFFGHSRIKNRLHTTLTPTNTSRLIGAEGQVTKTITSSLPGRVKIDDEEWRATAPTTISKDTQVKVKSVSGITLTVTKS